MYLGKYDSLSILITISQLCMQEKSHFWRTSFITYLKFIRVFKPAFDKAMCVT